MRPILAIIPQLPSTFFLPLTGFTVLVALGLAARNLMLLRALPVTGGATAPAVNEGANAPRGDDATIAALMPLAVALALGAGLFLWSRHEIKLHSYGFFLVVGFFSGTWNACQEARRRGYDPNLILDMALPMLAVTVLMCRLLYVILDWNQFHSFWEIFQVWSGGLSFHGAIIGGAMVGGYYAWTRRIGFWALLDIITPSVFLGYFFGRLGCLFNGCCYGGPTSVPWAMQFPDEAHPGLLTPPSHPTQLYSAALALALFVWMQHAKKQPRFNRFAGQPTLLFLALYALERGFVEIFRNGATAGTVLGTTWLTQAQFVSIVGLGVIAVLWVVFDRQARQLGAADAPPGAQVGPRMDPAPPATVSPSQTPTTGT